MNSKITQTKRICKFSNTFENNFYIPEDIRLYKKPIKTNLLNTLSYWDKTVTQDYDYIIIGAGIVGLSTAIELKTYYPDKKVLVLEAGSLASGASTRNAGFACFGSLTEILEDISHMGVDSTLDQIRDRWTGLNKLRSLLGDEAMDFKQTGNYEIITQDLQHCLKQINYVNNLLLPIFNDNVFSIRDKNINTFNLSSKYVTHLLFNKFEGQINSGKMMESLLSKAYSLGVIVRFGTKALKPYNHKSLVIVPVTSLKREWSNTSFKAKHVAICINGFTSQMIPGTGIVPGRGQILITKPLLNTYLPQVPFHLGKGFWYFRLLDDNRVLLGGGRNLNYTREQTTVLKTTHEILTPLNNILSSIILKNTPYELDFAWSGVMGFTKNHKPLIKTLPSLSNVVIGFGCNGMGIARGVDTGSKTAELLISL